MRNAASWIIIDKYKRILLTKRSNYTKAFPFYWTLPWWRWEPLENPKDIVIREIKEEVWLDFKPTKLYFSCIMENSWEDTKSHRFLWEWLWSIKIQMEEADWYAWYSYEEIKNLKIAFNYKEMIEMLYKDWLIN
jgi:ADP-ribose pyrophosphatase YjhB (NUDIX family)